MNKGLEAQGRANLQDSGSLTLVYRKEPKMTDETDKGGRGGGQRKKTGGCVIQYFIIVRRNEIKVGK